MRRGLSAGLALLGVIGFCMPVLANGEKHDHQHAEIGKAAPDFTLTDIEGKEHNLSDYKGKVVVLEWTNHLCPYVVRHQKEKKTMQKTYDQFKGQNVVWLAIDSTNSSFDNGYNEDRISKWAKSDEVNLPYPVLRDANGEVGHIYGAKTTPHMYVINKDGVLVYVGAIDDDRHGNKDGATNYVEAAVKAVLAGSEVEIPTSKPYGCSVKYAK